MSGPKLSWVTWLGVAVALVVGLGACTTPGEQPPPIGSSSQQPSRLPGNLALPREELAKGLPPTEADIVRMETSPIKPVQADWLKGWRIYDITSSPEYSPHPQRFYAALAESGTVVLLRGSRENFARIVREGVESVDTPELARLIAETYLDSTRTFAEYSYRISAIEDIKWRPKLDQPEQEKRRLVEDFGAKVSADGTATQDSTGNWAITIWMVAGTDLVTHRVVLSAKPPQTAGPALTDEVQTHATELPLPISI